MKKIISLSTLLIISFFIITEIYAQDPESCRTIYHKEGKIYEIKAAMYNGTYIKLPTKMLIDPVVGDSGLWTVEGDGHHVMVQPNSAHPLGKRSTLTLVDSQNISYNFKMVRVDQEEVFDTCITLKTNPKFFKGGKLSTYQTPEELVDKIQKQKIKELERRLKEEVASSEKKIDGLLKKYRTFIYTRYGWKNYNTVTDVYDDGRFTFIRLKPGHKGLLAVNAKVDNKKEMIEWKPQSETLYRISGIYSEFELKYGKSLVSVKRLDNQSNGVY